MKAWLKLVKREYWEHKSAFFKTPAIVCILLSLIGFGVCLSWIIKQTAASESNLALQIQTMFHQISPNHFLLLSIFALSVPFIAISWIIMGHYFLYCLYDDRQDNSFLFWQSMPISMPSTISSKAFTGLVLVPILAVCWTMVAAVALLLITTIGASVLHVSGLWSLFQVTTLLETGISLFITCIIQSLWLYPIFAWFMLCSSFSRQAPLLKAILPIVVLLIVESFFTNSHPLLGYFHAVLNHAFGLWGQTLTITSQGINWHIQQNVQNLIPSSKAFSLLEQFNNAYVVLGLCMGTVFFVLAGIVRRKRY